MYLNADVVTARLQLERMLQGSPVRIDDLDDKAYVLVAAVLPRRQAAADAVTPEGLRALGLPETYPRETSGEEVPREVCQRMGVRIRGEGLRGVWCRSACTLDGRARELAWFPATERSKATGVWRVPLPLGSWREAVTWEDLGLEDQPDPKPAVEPVTVREGRGE